MPLKMKRYVEESTKAVSSAGLGLLFTQIGPPPLGILGAGLGELAGAFAFDNVGRLINRLCDCAGRREVRYLLRGKLHADFDDSFLSEKADAERALREAGAMIKRASKFAGPRRDKRFDCFDSVSLPDTPLDDAAVRECLRLLRTHRKHIRISCTAVCAAVVAVLKSIQKEYGDREVYGENALDLEIDYDPSNGRDQVTKLIDSEGYDFAVVANDPFFFAKHNKTEPYKLLLPCNGADQYLFIRKGTKYLHSVRLHVLVESSADLHFRDHSLLRGAKKVPVFHVDEIPSLIENMGGGEGILAWNPLSSYLKRNPAYELVPKTDHHIFYCLRCHDHWTTKRAARARDAFKALFVDRWRYCNRNRRQAYYLLTQDRQYVHRFAKGTGFTRYH